MLTKEPEMLQLDAFCEHTMQQNAIAAGVPPRPRLGSLQRSPRLTGWFLGGRGGGGEGEEKEGEGK